MKLNASLALQKAMRTALLARPDLGAPVYDHVPLGSGEAWVVFTSIETRDWSTATDKGHEHYVILSVRSTAEGKREALNIVNEIEAGLDQAPLTLIDHRLVSLSVIFWSIQRARDGRGYEAMVRLRAATEVL